MPKALPQYQCHKVVGALKILVVTPEARTETQEGGAWLVFEEHGYSPLHVDLAFVAKHNPQPGGYYVVYEDGYASFSPAEPFEQGYTLISEE